MPQPIQATEIANFLLDIKAVKINVKEPFTWTSGIRSPIYCDCRVVNSHVEARNAVTRGFSDLITKEFDSQADIIGGVASGGISYGALVADRLSLPFIYVRAEKKAHGLKKQIEGDFEAGKSVVLIEDLISTGGSSIKAVEAARSEGLILVSLLSIMTYGFTEADNNFRQAGAIHKSLCNLEAILKVASEKGMINANDMEKLEQFRRSHRDWQP